MTGFHRATCARGQREAPRPLWRVVHDWTGFAHVVRPNGKRVYTIAKLASGRPGSGIPVDTQGKRVTGKLQAVCDVLNHEGAR